MRKAVRIILFICGGLLLFSPFFILRQVLFPDLLGKATVIQAIVALSLPVLLAAVWAEKNNFFSRKQPLILVLLAYAAVLILTSFTGIDAYQSFWGSDNRSLGVFNYLHYIAAFFIFLYILREDAWRKRYAFVSVGVGMIVALFAINEFASFNGTRASVFLGNPILLGGYLLFPLFVAVISAVFYNRYKRYAFVGASAFIFAALMASQTRGAFLGVIAGGFVSLTVYLFLSGKSQRKKILIKAALILGSAGFVLAILYVSGNSETKQLAGRFSSLSPSGSSANQRIIMYKIALRAAMERPVFGWGPENFDYAFDKYYDPQLLRYGVSETWSDRSHNAYLDALVMSGVPGFLIYLGIFAAAFWTIFKSVKMGKRTLGEGAILCGLVTAYAGAIFFAFDSPASLLYFMFALAYIAAPLIGKNDSSGKNSLWPFLAGAILGFGALMITVRNAQAGFHVLNAGYLPSAAASQRLEEYEKAFLLNPKLIRDFRLRFDNMAFEDAGAMAKEDARLMLDRAIIEMQKNVNMAPQNFSYRYALGNLYLERGMLFAGNDLDLADEAYALAGPFSPKRQALFFQHASVKYLKRDIAGAIELFKEAVELDPSLGQSHWRLGMAYAYNEEAAKAFEELETALYKDKARGSDYLLTDKGIEIQNVNYVPTLLKERQFISAVALREKNFKLLRTLILLSINTDGSSDGYGKLAAVELELGNFYAARAAVARLLALDPSAAPEAQVFLQEVKRREQTIQK